jgi:hypothetical protein
LFVLLVGCNAPLAWYTAWKVWMLHIRVGGWLAVLSAAVPRRAKHMVTAATICCSRRRVISFLSSERRGLYVTLFAVGHSFTLLLGVLAGIHANAYSMRSSAFGGLKALENIGAFRRMGINIDRGSRTAGHGFGLSTKLQDLTLSRDGLVATFSPST